jgi:hypothetical protein
MVISVTTISWISKCIKHVGFIKMKDHFVVSMANTGVSNSTKRSGNFSRGRAIACEPSGTK